MMEKQQSFHEKKRNKEPTGKRGDLLLHLAARTGDLVKVKEILRDCGDGRQRELLSMQNQDGETAMYVAAENGHTPVVSELLKASDFQTAALTARNGYDSFHIAAKQGHLDVLKELLQSFPNLAMTTDSSNSTALHTAATQGHTDIVNLLLERDASLAKIAKNNGKTILHSAARMGHLEVVKSLLSTDPTIGSRTDKKGQTALHMAVKGQNIEVVHALLKPEPSVVNLEDNKGNTALHIATRKGRTQIMQALLLVEGMNVNAINKAGETALDIAEKSTEAEQLTPILREAGAVTARELANPPSAARQLKQTVSDIKHEVQSQLQQTRQTRMRVQKIAKRLKKLHIGGLNNAINSATVVAVLIATVAFAAIFTVPGQFVENETNNFEIGQAYIARKVAFIIFLIFDSIALFISLAVVVVQTSVVVIEQKKKKQLVFVINKLMWLACLFISVAFISLTYVVVGHNAQWLAVSTTVIGSVIMLTTLGSMCYWVIRHRIEESSMRNIRRTSCSQSRSMSVSMISDPELLHNEYKRMYAL
ncbi:ankyrin repeat-containing protein At5g02620-like [Magnolia sinica]|uniref:ankyrin repeat-containing protein At5g02620-like n=1 Tax=Magnolia sinica TaxID=86752 RepID=UPI002659E78F|nr:ankyrin repeat-containing protein At5g02620-like [Magnolia sinica]XP_058101923.1 ankyrin repeat-containing protein At5g02620-like [Magnolia sinica]XP_058101924.1 ankyrin repeat-containing protein At5g02620-like [Magnolia sinica]